MCAVNVALHLWLSVRSLRNRRERLPWLSVSHENDITHPVCLGVPAPCEKISMQCQSLLTLNSVLSCPKSSKKPFAACIGVWALWKLEWASPSDSSDISYQLSQSLNTNWLIVMAWMFTLHVVSAYGRLIYQKSQSHKFSSEVSQDTVKTGMSIHFLWHTLAVTNSQPLKYKLIECYSLKVSYWKLLIRDASTDTGMSV